MKDNIAVPTPEELEGKIVTKLLLEIDNADAKSLADALGNYGMFTAAMYRRACTLQAHTLTKAPTLAP